MIGLVRPDDRSVRRALERAAGRPLTYPSPGMTRAPAPPGWPVSHIRVPLGRGPEPWRLAVAGLDRWDQYRTGWTSVHPPEPAVAPGTPLAVVGRHYGLWSVNCCRVVYGPDPAQSAEGTHAYAIGTLDVHAETGEERFAVERMADETVWFAVTTYARPHHPLARLAPPLVRRVQHRFARDAAAAMRRMLAV